MSLLPSIGKVVSQGYVVVATDYEGLGTPGTHPYLVGESEARGVLDIVKAAQQIPETGASNKTFVWGQSQGGQAALFAGEIQPTYAPELDLLGVDLRCSGDRRHGDVPGRRHHPRDARVRGHGPARDRSCVPRAPRSPTC